jgi:D-threonate/D-erythronate kinase
MMAGGTGHLRLVADDLTGALDSAAPFAAPDAPVTVLLGNIPATLPARCAVSTESRNLPVADAIDAVERAAVGLRAGSAEDTLWFKKVDSVLRGHPFDETAALFRQLGRTSCIFAPAFPAEGRVTLAGQHGVLRDDVWHLLPNGNLRDGLALAGIAAAIVPDAATQEDLVASVAQWKDRRDVLWAGARGLAEALAGPRAGVRPPPIAAIVIGTTHPATQAQAAMLREAGTPAPVFEIAAQCRDAAATLAAVRHLFRNADAGLPDTWRVGQALMIVGGDTLAAALSATDATAVDVVGEVAPGIPFGRIVGGSMAGCRILTKSGGFGAPDRLVRLVMGH